MATSLATLELAAARLGPLLDELTLVGGNAVGLLITAPAADPPRPTLDLDFVVEAATLAQYGAFERKLRDCGFTQSFMQLGDPLCRWRAEDLVLDVMPPVEEVLGFSNRWYPSAIEHRLRAVLPSGALLSHADAPHFLATKLEAFQSRGEGDALSSHDLEDAIRVVDGRRTVLDECRAAQNDLRAFVAEHLQLCLADRFFIEALSGYFSDPQIGAGRARIVESRLRALASM
jgi:hypothetical protein